MSEFIDLTGQKFGEWTVLRRADNGKQRQVRWECRCDGCGKIYIVVGKSLYDGKSTQCRSCSGTAFIDLTGQKFGKWTVLEQDDKNKHRRIRWECRCEGCGEIHIVDGNRLRRGGSTQCKSCSKTKSKLSNYEAIINSLYSLHKISSKRRKLISELSLNEYKLLISKPCCYCGSRNDNNHTKKRFKKIISMKYTGIDRVNSTKGYTIDNTVPCCWVCNRAKGSMTQEEWHQYTIRFVNCNIDKNTLGR